MSENRKEIVLSSEQWTRQLDILSEIKDTWVNDFVIEKGRAPTYNITTFGCQMNERDSEQLNGLLDRAGFVFGEKDDADLLLYNTCAVREHAELRVIGNVGALRKRKKKQKDLIVGVCGCMMQQQEVADELFKKYPFVDLVFGTHALYQFPDLLQTCLSGKRVIETTNSEGMIAENIPTIRKEGPSAYVTVMLGCNNFCSYCIVPYVRGRERSRQPNEIIKEIESMVSDGVSEVTLIGQNVNSYGSDFDDKQIDFADLIFKVAEIDGVERIRFMSSHPKDLSDTLINSFVNCDKLSKHIHLAMQSGSDRILKLMNRKYTQAEYLGKIEKLRAAVPSIEITTDFIVGFPGETDEDFAQTLEAVEKARFAHAYSFMYSPRNGTKAAEMVDQLSLDEKKRRLYELNKKIAAVSVKDRENYIGKVIPVLVEGRDTEDANLVFGRCDSFQKVFFEDDSADIGDYVDVLVERARRSSLWGTKA